MNAKRNVTAVQNILSSHKLLAGRSASMGRQLLIPLIAAGIAARFFTGLMP